jgi:thiamine biosynthesis lipoprotein
MVRFSLIAISSSKKKDMIFKKTSKYRLLVILFFLFGNVTGNAQTLRKRTTLLMGGRFDISIVAEDSLSAESNIDLVIAEITRIENLISDWKSDSQISEVNRNAGIKPVVVDPEVFNLTKRALRLSEITQGAFDISFAAMERIWKFDGTMTGMPSEDAIKKAVEKVGYRNIILDPLHSTIFLKNTGMKIGFGALGEGYAADKCRTLMLQKGVDSGIVNASGDMITWGSQPNGKPWNIGITNPFDTEKIIAVIPITNKAVTTSGSYEKFVILNGKRYSHIINPATGYPATGLCSVTVLGPSAEMANGFSTSIMVLGKEEGLKLLNKFPDYSCLMITDKGKVIKSKNYKK